MGMDSRYIEILVTETRGVKRLRRMGTSFVVRILFEERTVQTVFWKKTSKGNTFRRLEYITDERKYRTKKKAKAFARTRSA